MKLSRDKNFYKTLLTLTLTIALQNVVVNGVGLADNIMLGGYSEDALSGVSLANQIQFLLQMVVMGMGEGLIIIGSQYWGKRQIEPIKKIINIGLIFAMAVSVLFFVVIASAPHWALSLFTNDEDVIAEGVIYLRIICYSYFFFCLTNTLLNGLKAVETVKIGLGISIMTLFVNIALNYCLIYGHFGFPAMGTAGAAIATLIARILESVVVVVYYLKVDKKLGYRLRDLKLLDKGLLRDYVRVGTPVMVSNAMWGTAMGIQASILGHLGGPTIAANAIAANIFNIISSGDIVPRLLPEEWSFHRNGNDRFLPSTRNEEELEDLNEMGKNDFGPTPLDFSWLATDKETDEVMLRMEEYFISRENYHEKYEAALMDMIQCAFIRSEEEVTQNKVLDDGEVIQRLRTLTHLKNMDYWKISRAVWAASTMSRAVLKRVDAENIPIRAQQIVVPILAVGLCYGLESEAVSLIAKYILMFVAMKSAPDDAIRAAFCHHCENYIALMEYYAPSEHCMEATTRT